MRHSTFACIHPAIPDIAPDPQAFGREHHTIEQAVVVIVKKLCCTRVLSTRGSSSCPELFLAIANSKQTGCAGASEKEVSESILIHVARGHGSPVSIHSEAHVV